MWTVKQHSDNVHEIVIKYEHPLDQYILCISDLHYDNPKCRRDLLKLHLDMALERNAPIIVVGDILCLMQGKYDPRKSMEGLRPEHRKEDYLGAVIETTAKDFEKYAHLFAVIGYGNHETNILNRQGVDMIKWLCRTMRETSDQEWPFAGAYRGWINVKFEYAQGKSSESKKIWYDHGSGGGGAVTKGTIKAHRRAASVDGADVILSGHVHEFWSLKSPKFTLSRSKRSKHFMQRHLQLSTYKDEIKDGGMGWANEKSFFPKPLGGYWLRFTKRNERVKINVEEAD